MRAALSAVFAATIALAPPAVADASGFRKVTDRTEFLSLVNGKQLRIGIYGLRISVVPDGSINGSASGWDLTGSWSWQDGYFCREMDWSGYEIDYNCQLVEVRGDDRMRFTVDRGNGRSAEFNLR